MRGFLLAAAAAAIAGAGLVLAQPAAERGVTPTTIAFGLEEQANSFSTDEENLGFRRTITWEGYPRTGGDAAAEAVANATL